MSNLDSNFKQWSLPKSEAISGVSSAALAECIHLAIEWRDEGGRAHVMCDFPILSLPLVLVLTPRKQFNLALNAAS